MINMRGFVPGGVLPALLYLGATTAMGGPADALVLAKDGKTDYHVVIDCSCSLEVKAAADELILLLKLITDADFPLVGSEVTKTDKEIVLGNNWRHAALGIKPDWVPIAPRGVGVAALPYQYGYGPLLPRASQYRLLRDAGVKESRRPVLPPTLNAAQPLFENP